MAAVAQHGDPIRDGVDFIQPMADVNNADALRAQFAHYLEQALDLARSERGGGFIHHNDACLLRKCLGDLDDLLLGHGKVAAERVRINLHADPIKQLAGLIRFLLVRN